MNVLRIDADQIGHEALADESIREQIRAIFGSQVFHESGSIDRKQLAQQVFGPDPQARAAREQLEQIVHPWIGDRISKQIAEARNDHWDAILLDAAVLLESGWSDQCDSIVFVESSASDRLERVTTGRGWSAEEFQTRENSQLALETKKTRSDFVVDNTSQLEHAVDQLEQHVTSLRHS